MEMRKLLLILLLLPSYCFGQRYLVFSSFGTNTTDTALSYNTLLLPKYANADVTKFLTTDERGKVYLAVASGGGGSADSTTFATQYRVDSMRANIYGQIELKLNISDTAGHWIGIGWLPALMKYTDTAALVAPYLKENDTAGMLSPYVRNNRTINTTYPVQGGGDLSADRTITVDTGRAVGQLITGGRNKQILDSTYATIPTNPTLIANVQAQVQTSNYSFSDADHDADFMVDASCIIRVNNAFAHGTPISYLILDYTDGHGNSWFSSVEPGTSEGMKVNFPLARRVFWTTGGCVDESFASYLVSIGPSVSTSNALFRAYRPAVVGQRIRGDGAGNWVQQNSTSYLSLSTYNTGDGTTSFNIDPGVTYIDYGAIGITYMGPNNYGIRRHYAGLGSYNVKFELVDRSTGLFVGTNPTTDDEIVVTPCGTVAGQIALATWVAGNNDWIGGSFNFWVAGRFEAWMIAKPASSTSNIVRWQLNYPSATNYKIYRDTDPNFGTEVLIHTGTSGTYLDTGLSPATLYYYKEVAVVGGVDTDVTTFNCRTK